MARLRDHACRVAREASEMELAYREVVDLEAEWTGWFAGLTDLVRISGADVIQELDPWVSQVERVVKFQFAGSNLLLQAGHDRGNDTFGRLCVLMQVRHRGSGMTTDGARIYRPPGQDRRITTYWPIMRHAWMGFNDPVAYSKDSFLAWLTEML